MKNALFILLFGGLLLLAGCAQQQPTKYVCADGTTVSSASECTPQTVRITSYDEAIERLSSRQEIMDEWKNGAVASDCAISKQDPRNAVASVMKVDFENNLIECITREPYPQFLAFLDGITMYNMSSMTLRSCNQTTIDQFKLLVNGFHTTGLDESIIKILEPCTSCKQVYVIFTYCNNPQYPTGFERSDYSEGSYGVSSKAWVGTFYVDANTGQLYE